MGYEIDFLPADKSRISLEIDSITLGVHSQACSKYPKQYYQNNKFRISLQYSKENVKLEVDFCMLIIVKGFFKVIYTIILDVCSQACPNYSK